MSLALAHPLVSAARRRRGAAWVLGGALLLASCAKPTERAERVEATPGVGGEPVFQGVPAAGALASMVETDVPGELTMRVPGDWIGQQKLATGHAMFSSRDGRVVVTVTEAAPGLLSNDGVVGWATKPWTKVTTPSVGAFRPIALGRSALAAEQAGGTALLEGKPARAASVRLARATSKGAVAVLVSTFVRDDAASDDRARAEAAVRSLGTR